MNIIPFASESLTMSSVELLEMVNAARKQFGETDVRRNDFAARCRDELDGEHYETFVVKNPNGTESEAVRMTRDQCMYVLMRESKAVRRAVASRLKTIEAPAIPQTLPDALRLAADLAEQKFLAEQQRDEAIATKAQIGSRREATAMATAAAAKRKAETLEAKLDTSKMYATVKRVERATGVKFNWRILKRVADEIGIPPMDVFDQNYGSVKSYHAEVWRKAFSVEISEDDLRIAA